MRLTRSNLNNRSLGSCPTQTLQAALRIHIYSCLVAARGLKRKDKGENGRSWFPCFTRNILHKACEMFWGFGPNEILVSWCWKPDLHPIRPCMLFECPQGCGTIGKKKSTVWTCSVFCSNIVLPPKNTGSMGFKADGVNHSTKGPSVLQHAQCVDVWTFLFKNSPATFFTVYLLKASKLQAPLLSPQQDCEKVYNDIGLAPKAPPIWDPCHVRGS